MKEALISPKDPTETGIDEPELVTGGVDGNNTLDIERPFKVRVDERSYKTTRRSIDVDRDVQPGTLLKVVHCWDPLVSLLYSTNKKDLTEVAHEVNVLEVTSVGTS